MQQPVSCPNCGVPVLPDPRAGGAWIDQAGSYTCPNGAGQHTGPPMPPPPQPPHPRPQAPHPQAPHPQPPGPVRPRSLGIRMIVGIVGGVIGLILLIVAAAAIVVPRLASDEGQYAGPAGGGQPTGAPPASSAPAPTPTPSAPAAAPVPCQQDWPDGPSCFPDDRIGPRAMKHLHREYDMPCHRMGEQDGNGHEVDQAGRCDAANDVDQNYLKQVSIGYETYEMERTGPVTTFRISSSTGANDWQGETTSAKNTYRLSKTAVRLAASAIWPDNKTYRKQAMRTFARAQRSCSSGKPTTKTMPLGYEVSCDRAPQMQIETDQGISTSFTQSVRIEAPGI